MASERQLKVLKIMEEKSGISMSDAMREAGYKESYINNPKRVLTAKSFQDLLDKRLPDRHILNKHREMLDAPRHVRTFVKGELKTEVEETDPSAVKALDMAYKLKGKYISNPDEAKKNQPVIINLIKFSNGTNPDNNTISVQSEVLPDTDPGGLGKRLQEISSGLAS